MITIFSHPRPFTGEFDELQRAAIASWMGLSETNVLLLGKDAEKVALGLEIDWAPITGYNEHGTALVNSIFETGHAHARGDVLVQISSDIILSGDSAEVFHAVAVLNRPFVVGARFDMDRGEYGEPVMRKHPGSAADWFAYKRGTLGEIPPFAVGRTIYDQWLMWAAQELWSMDVIDATDDVFAIHPAHSYPEYGEKRKMLDSQERKVNHELARKAGYDKPYNVEHAPWRMTGGEVIKR